MKYIDLQRRLKQYQVAGLVTVKLNSALPVLEVEYERCLQLGLSQSDLERLTAIKNYEYLEFISCLEIDMNGTNYQQLLDYALKNDDIPVAFKILNPLISALTIRLNRASFRSH